MSYDCRTCGACCSYKWSWPILRRDRSDAAGIPEEMVRKDLPLMKTIENRCVALCGSVGDRVSCTVHENKPSACRKFEAGSDLCKEARKAFNLPI